jgi:hypothetical protein
MIQDVWDELPLEVPADTTVGELKRQALSIPRIQRDPSDYVMKFRGFELRDESASLEAAGLVPNAALVVIPRRRRAAR